MGASTNLPLRGEGAVEGDVMSVDQLRADSVRRWTTRDLAATFPGTTSHWWLRHARSAERLGVLAKRGKYWFGRQADIESWLMSDSGGPNA